MSDYPSFDDAEAIIQDLYARGVLTRDTPEGQGDTGDTEDRGDQGDSHRRPRTAWTAAELMATDFPDPRWAVPGLITEGVNLLAGPPKVGKSWLTLGMSLAIASQNGIALGAVKVEQGPVLYLALEDTPRRLKDRLGRMLAGGDAPAALTLATVCPPLPDGGDAMIANWLKRNPDARLVVLDVFARMRGTTPPGANAYDADYNAVVRAKLLADHFGVPFILVHHVRKAASADFLETVSGTNGLAGAADTILVLKRTRGAADAELHVTGRDVDERKLALKFTADLGLWQQLDGDPAEHLVADTRAAILRGLRQQGPATPKAIADALDLDHELVKKTVRRMAEDGQLDTDGRGTYLLPVPAVPLSPPAVAQGSQPMTTARRYTVSTIEYTHWSYFPSQADADQCAAALGRADFACQVKPSRVDQDGEPLADDTPTTEWLLLATKPVEVDRLEHRHAEVETVVGRHGGDYDGGESSFPANRHNRRVLKQLLREHSAPDTDGQ
jgi:hypothetical protein